MATTLTKTQQNEAPQLSGKHVAGKLKITTFLNNRPINMQNTFFKACTHPLAIDGIKKFINQLESLSAVALYDPFNNLAAFASLYDLSAVNISNVYVQQVSEIGNDILSLVAKPVDQVYLEKPKAIAIFAFDAQIQIGHIRHLLADDCAIFTLDDIKIPTQYLTHQGNYLSQLNFATNFGFLRDEGGLHTRITMSNYWGVYGAKDTQMYLWLFDASGNKIAQWQETLGGAGQLLTIDSREIRERFNLPEFTGNLFMHAVNIVVHDIVKYVCDIYDTNGKVHSVTHDSNSWPADFYAGVLAPQEGEKVVLWIQNCYPTYIAPDSIGLRVMGHEDVVYLKQEIAPFATYAWDLGSAILAKFPVQYEILANKYFTRPRYEVLQPNGCRYISHANVERIDLTPDKGLKDIAQHLGKGYILPFPIMPTDRFETIIIPTPMATTQKSLPLCLYVYDYEGNLVVEKTLAAIAREDSIAIDIESLVGTGFKGGHVDISYDKSGLAEADGWLHAIARYRNKETGQAAETSFGAHIYNTAIVYKNEPQSYKGNPPGLRTTLSLRTCGGDDTFCNLIYPCSKEWLPYSSTDLILYNEKGQEIARNRIAIPMNGSVLWTYKEKFTASQRAEAGERAHIIIKDTTCRLFGFHGQVNGNNIFSLDHMFGF